MHCTSDSARAHGGLLERELDGLGIDADDVIDFSVNVNPYGPSESMLRAIHAARVDRYPDPTSHRARASIAACAGVDPDEVVVGNGAVDLMWTLARAFVSQSTTAAIIEPAFSEFRAAVRAAGGRIAPWRAREEDAFAIDLDAVMARVRESGASLVYLCAPANPTGTCVDAEAIAAFATKLDGTLVVLDQSFLALSTRHADANVRLPSNVVRVRSLTKDHAIPGLRVGYLTTTRAVAARIEAQRPPWVTSALAQAAAMTAIAEPSFVDESRVRLLEDRARLTTRLRDAGLTVLDSSTIYALVRVGDAANVRTRLLTRDRLLVRDCTSFGLPHMIRICARPKQDEDALVAALTREVTS